MKFSHIIYDIDGTLVDTEKTLVLSLQRTVKDLMGEDMSYEKAYTYFGIPSAKVAGILGYADGKEFLEVWEENFSALRSLIIPFDGIEKVMDEVHDAGAVTGVVTSRSHREMDMDPLMERLMKDIDIVVCSEDLQRSKPHPDPMYRFLELASAMEGRTVEASECLYIGDTDHDWKSANAAGIRFALADWKKKGMQEIPAEYAFTDADGLRGILGL